MLLLMKKIFLFCREDKVIAKIFFKKKSLNLMRIQGGKSKGIVNKQTLYLRG